MAIHPYNTCTQPCFDEIPGILREGKEHTLKVEPNVEAQYCDRQRQHNLISVPNRNAKILMRT